MSSLSDVSALVLVAIAFAVGLWANLEAFESLDSELQLAETAEMMVASGFDIGGMLLVVLAAGYFIARWR